MNLQSFLGFKRQSLTFSSVKHIESCEYRKVKSRSASSSDSNKSTDGNTIVKDSASINHETVSVALIGGGITPAYTALLLKQIPIIKFVYVADVNDNAAGLMLDASHVDTSAKIRYFNKNNISNALREVNRVIRKPQKKLAAKYRNKIKCALIRPTFSGEHNRVDGRERLYFRKSQFTSSIFGKFKIR